MRALVFSIFAWSIAGAAQAQDVNQPATPAADRQSIAIGADQCIDVRDGLPPLGGYTRAPLIRWGCHGRDNQIMHVENGVLLVGPERAFHTRPMYAPSRGCIDHDHLSGGVHYIFRACAGRGAFSVDRSTAGTVIYRFYAPGGRPAVTRGAPLIAERIESGVTAFSRFEMVDNELRVSGTNLCVAPASANTAEGAPLYLDDCSAPDQVDAANTADGAARERIAFVTVEPRP